MGDEVTAGETLLTIARDAGLGFRALRDACGGVSPTVLNARLAELSSRAVIRAAIEGALDDVAYVTDPVFGLDVPVECPGIPAELLSPRGTWSDKAAYDEKATALAGLFRKNFEEFAELAGPELAAAGPVA